MPNRLLHRLKWLPSLIAGLVLVACAGEVVQSTVHQPPSSVADVVQAVITAINSGDEAALDVLAQVDDLVFVDVPSESETPSLAEFVAVAHSVAVEADSEWALTDLTEDAGSAVATIGVTDIDPSMLELKLELTTDGWKLAAIGPIPVEIPPGSLTLRVVDSGNQLSLKPEVIGPTELYIEVSNNAGGTRQCEILDVAGVDSDEILEGLIGRPDERDRRLRGGMPPISSGETTVAHYVDGIEPGSYLMLCYAAADSFLDLYGHRFTVSEND